MNFNTSNIRKDLRDLTIVVATFERPKFILRQVKYLSNLNAQVIITDGSKRPLSSNLLSMIEKLPHIQYVHNERSYVERVSSIANEINTPFAMCLADDDLYLQTGLFSAIRKLEEDLSAVACMGQSLGLDRAFNRAYVFKYGANLSLQSNVYCMDLVVIEVQHLMLCFVPMPLIRFGVRARI
jgi:glycosyltransferase domain-containing protein